MAVSKVIYAGRMLVDLTADTVDAAHLSKGYTAHDASGEAVTGTMDGGGSTSVKRGFANFVDHDGTVIQSLTRDEVAALTAMPDGPTHDGLTFQGWNYTLDALKAAEDGADVGATYVTSDGKTHMGVLVSDESRATAHVNFTAKVDGGVTIAWGDGSTTTSSGTSNRSYEHTYAAAGEYDLTLSVADGCTVTLGSGSNSKAAFGEATNGERNMLQSLRIGGGITSIGSSAFSGCYSLASVTIPQGVTSIQGYAFQYCYSLASVTIPQGVTSIGSSAFSGCYSLASVTIPQGVTSIWGSVFSGCYSLASVTIPQGVTSIQSYAFSDCYSLASVTIPQGVTSIDGSAFSGCYSLASVTIPQGVTSIRDYAFSGCSSLASVTIQQGVTSIGVNAFSGCNYLGRMVLEPETPPTLTASIGTLPTDCIILVPADSWDAYTSASHWSDYAAQTYTGYGSIATIALDAPERAYTGMGDFTVTASYFGANHAYVPESQRGCTWAVSGPATIAADGDAVTVTPTDAAAAGDVVTLTCTSTHDAAVSTTANITIATLTYADVDGNDGAWAVGDDGHTWHSVSAYHVSNGSCTCTISATGQMLTVVAWNDSETNYDYVTLSELDGTVTRNSSKSCKGTTPSSPKMFTYDLGGAQHTVQVMYSKDSSGDNNSDAGYFYAYVD